MPGSKRTSSLVALALLLTAVAVPLLVAPTVRHGPPPPERPEVVVLRNYVGRDLLDASDRDLQPLLDALYDLDQVRAEEFRNERLRLGREYDTQTSLARRIGWLPVPRYVWLFGRPGAEPGYLVFERDYNYVTPGTTVVRLTLIDPGGDVRARARFTTGRRLYLDDARLERQPGFEYPVLVLDTSGLSRHLTRQVYALSEGQFDLVRVEDEKGAILPTGKPR